MTIELGHYLALGAVLFFIGAGGFLVRRNALVSLMCIELMLNAVNLTLIAFNRWQRPLPVGNPAVAANDTLAQLSTPPHGQMFAFFVIAVAAAEAAVGLAIVLSLYRIRKSVRIDDADKLRQ